MRLAPTLAVLSLALAGNVLAGEVGIPVLASAVTAGQRIEASNLTTKMVDEKAVYASTISQPEELAGMQATRKLAAGVPLTKLQVKPAMDVQRNSLVNLVYNAPGVQLSGSAQALEEGRVGQSIRVLNVASRATLVGVVTAPDTVEIR